jgi:hypothetical protein
MGGAAPTLGNNQVIVEGFYLPRHTEPAAGGAVLVPELGAPGKGRRVGGRVGREARAAVHPPNPMRSQHARASEREASVA